jgi:uncharacterized repeat protein (TIGR03843 family)
MVSESGDFIQPDIKTDSVVEESKTPDNQGFISDKERILSSRESTEKSPLGGGANVTEIVFLKDDGKGVFKPEEGERGIWRFDTASYKRERAAYLMDRFLGFDFVPPTVIRQIDDAIGSFQEFIPNTNDFFKVPENQRMVYNEQLIKMAIFDYIIRNNDRHSGNFLIQEEEQKVYAIDHGYAFGQGEPLDFGGYVSEGNVPEGLTEKLSSLLASEKMMGLLKELMGELLSQAEVKALLERLGQMNLALKNAKSLNDIKAALNP